MSRAEERGPPAQPTNWKVAAPPGPRHDVTIDVTSGTWMSIDVSPDGLEIVFDLLGDIYVMPISGGEARPVTSDVPWDVQPRYSPNGRWLAFTSDRSGGDNIWIVDRNGANLQQVTQETFRLVNQADWSPDSQFIVARKNFTSGRAAGAGEIWIYHRSGGEGLQLRARRTPQKDTGEPVFSPDGRHVFFSEDLTPGDVWEYNRDPNTQIYAIQRLDRDTGEIEAQLAGPGGSIRPTPSPDGRSLAFVRRERSKSVLYVMDVASGRETPLYDGLDRDMQESLAGNQGVYPGMSWMPDSRSIVFWAGGKILRLDVTTRHLSDIPFHVRGTRSVADAHRAPIEVAPKQFDVKLPRSAKVSPSGGQVVFDALGSLWIRDLPAGVPRRLTRQSEHFELFPSWSRDGRFIAYATWSDEELGAIRVVSSRGGEGRKITATPCHCMELAFSPDGSTIAYRAATGGILTPTAWGRSPGIYVMPASGGPSKLVTRQGVLPQFGASNERLYFMADEPVERAEGAWTQYKRSLRSIRIDGADERKHLISEAATEYAVSPDENYVAWVERFSTYVVPFARTGKPLEIGPRSKALPQRRVTREGGAWIHWAGAPNTLWWSIGPQLFSADLSESETENQPPPQRARNMGFATAHDAPQGRVAFTGARVISMRGDEVIEPGTILVNGNRIEALGANVSVPPDALRIDITGKTVVPGLIDAHWHGTMSADSIVPQQNWVHFAALAFGVTTVIEPSGTTSDSFTASELAKAGRIVAPRIISTGASLYGATFYHTATIDSLEDALTHARRMKAVGATLLKSYMQPRRDQRQQIVEAARQLNMTVIPEGGARFHENLSELVDGHATVEHALPVATIYEDVLQLWSGTKTAYTPTLVIAYGGPFGENYFYETTPVWQDPKLARFVPRRMLDARARRPTMVPADELNYQNAGRVAKALSERGVSIQAGGHGQREGLSLHWEMWLLAQSGFSPMEALKAATINSARVYGLDRDLGSLEPGKLADFAVLDADPLENIRNSTSVEMTVVNGRVYDADLNEIGSRKRPRKAFWFEKPDGQAWTRRAGAAHAQALEHD